MRTLWTIVLAGCFAASASAGVIIVDPSGAGQYKKLSVAAAHAAPGDILLLRPGHYGMTNVDRPLTIVADGTGEVSTESIIISDLAPFETVLLCGLAIRSVFGDAAVEIEPQQGSVLIQDCSLTGSTFLRTQGLVVDHAAATLLGCAITGFPTQFSTTACFGTRHAIECLDADLALFDCTVVGGDAPDSLLPGPPGCPGGDGLFASGRGFISGCVIEGGPGGDNAASSAGGASGGHGIHNVGAGSWGQILDTVAVGGAGGIYLDGTSGPTGAAVVGGFEFLPGAARTVTVPSPVVEQQAGSIDVSGSPGDIVFLFASMDVGWQLVPGRQGVILLGSAPWATCLGALGPDGTLSAPFSVPASALPGAAARGSVMLAQAVHLSGSTVLMGGAATVVVLDSSI